MTEMAAGPLVMMFRSLESGNWPYTLGQVTNSRFIKLERDGGAASSTDTAISFLSAAGLILSDDVYSRVASFSISPTFHAFKLQRQQAANRYEKPVMLELCQI
jgi:hypothetical protein